MVIEWLRGGVVIESNDTYHTVHTRSWQHSLSYLQVCTLMLALVLLIGQHTCDSLVVGSSPGCAPLRSCPGPSTYACVPLSPSSIIWYQPSGMISLAGKVTTGLVESNDILPLGL